MASNFGSIAMSCRSGELSLCIENLIKCSVRGASDVASLSPEFAEVPGARVAQYRDNTVARSKLLRDLCCGDTYYLLSISHLLY